MKCSKYLPFLICIIIVMNIILVGYFVATYMHTQKNVSNIPNQQLNNQSMPMIITELPVFGNGRVWPPDTLNNKYAHPVRDATYNMHNRPYGIPTNVGYVNTSYRQMGILVPESHSSNKATSSHLPTMLILMGRPLYVNRNKWQYYAITDQRNGVKLTIRVRGKASTNEYGVDELSTTDKVDVQGYNCRYTVDLYENDYQSYE